MYISFYNSVRYNVPYTQVYLTGSTHVTTMDKPLVSFLSVGSLGYNPRTFVIQAIRTQWLKILKFQNSKLKKKN